MEYRQLITPGAPGQSYVRKVAHLQVVVVVKAVWGIFKNTNGSFYKLILVIYKSRYYSIHFFFFLDCLIGVHCTHGVNRTGYLICRYLIQKLKWDPDVAIQGKQSQDSNELNVPGRGINVTSFSSI